MVELINFPVINKRNDKDLRKILLTVVLCLPIAIIISSLFVLSSRLLASSSTNRWFSRDLPLPEEVSRWSKTKLDQELFRLSRWENFAGIGQFKHFVHNQIRSLRLNKTDDFYFLEVGVGVGAFAREILSAYPMSKGYGIDVVPETIAIARAVLPKARMNLSTADMRSIAVLSSKTFDVIYVPGAICYLENMNQVSIAVAEFIRLLKVGGGLCLSMIASDISDMGSCNTRIPKSFWTNQNSLLKVVSIEEMDEWHLPHSFGRYAVCLRKI